MELHVARTLRQGEERVIERAILRELLSVENFPTLPEIMTRILDAAASDDTSAAEMTTIIERDHAISIRILRLANSAFYGLRSPVHSTRAAVIVLGFNTVRLLALATSVFTTLARRQQFALEPHDFWMHSFGAAKAAQLIANRRHKTVGPDAFFTAGLIHDMGRYALALALKEEYRAVVETAKESGLLLGDVELKRLNTTSAEVGAWLAEKWGLPPNITSMIRHIRRARTYSGADRADVATIALADQVSRVAGFGLAGDHQSAAIDVGLLDVVELTSGQIEEVVEESRALVHEARQFIGSLGED